MLKVLKTRSFWQAAVLTLACAVLGVLLAKLPGLKLVGTLVIALLLGMALQVKPSWINASKTGIGFISNKFLRLGIILLGFRLNLMKLAQAGVKTILIAIFLVAVTICLTYYLCERFGAESDLAILTAAGCGICGAAAVMGVSPQITGDGVDEETKRENEALAIAVVCVMGTLFTLIEIGLKPVLHMTQSQFGIMAGGSLHEIAHAVAAGGAGGTLSLDDALIMKLSRVLLLAPVALLIGIWYQKLLAKRNQAKGTTTTGKQKLPIPWFMAGFLISSIIGTFIPLPQVLIDGLVQAAYIFLGMAMAALGMSVNFAVIAKRGKSVFTAALISSIVLLILAAGAAKLFF